VKHLKVRITCDARITDASDPKFVPSVAASTLLTPRTLVTAPLRRLM